MVVDRKGMAASPEESGQQGEEVVWLWLEAKEMWLGGCQSFVATRRTKRGEERRVLIRGVMERPPVTARVPFCFARHVLVIEYG